MLALHHDYDFLATIKLVLVFTSLALQRFEM
jgi:hypothetical protein